MKKTLILVALMPYVAFANPYTLHLIGQSGGTRDIALTDPSSVDGFNCRMSFWGDLDQDGQLEDFEIAAPGNCPTMNVSFALDGFEYPLPPVSTTNMDVYDGFIYMPGLTLTNCHRQSGGAVSTVEPSIWFADSSNISINSTPIQVIPNTFDWYIVAESLDGDVVCDGAIPFTPPVIDLIFRHGFE